MKRGPGLSEPGCGVAPSVSVHRGLCRQPLQRCQGLPCAGLMSGALATQELGNLAWWAEGCHGHSSDAVLKRRWQVQSSTAASLESTHQPAQCYSQGGKDGAGEWGHDQGSSP